MVGRLARLELLPGVPLWRAYAVPAAELRYTADVQAVILGVTVAAARVPGDLLLSGQRVDVWQAGRLVGSDLRVVAIAHQPAGKLVVALESTQELVPELLAVSGRADTALTLAPLERLPTPTLAAAPAVTAPPTPTPTPTVTADADCHARRRGCPNRGRRRGSTCGGARHRLPGTGDAAGWQPPDAGGTGCRGALGAGLLRGG